MEHTGLSWTPKWTCWLNFKIEQNHPPIATEKINFFLKHDCPRLNILQQFERDFDIDHLVIKLTETTWQAVRAVLIPFVQGVSRDRLSQVSAVGPSCPDIADSLPHYSGTFLCEYPEPAVKPVCLKIWPVVLPRERKKKATGEIGTSTDLTKLLLMSTCCVALNQF